MSAIERAIEMLGEVLGILYTADENEHVTNARVSIHSARVDLKAAADERRDREVRDG